MLSKINSEVISFFPQNILNEFSNISSEVLERACELHFRVGQPVIVSGYNNEYILNNKITTEDILRIVENFSDNSIYSIQNEINNGFITIKGGHRVGITGTCVFEDNKIKSIKYISSLNIRIAREVKNCGLDILKKLFEDNKAFENTIIISPPRMRKDNHSSRYD